MFPSSKIKADLIFPYNIYSAFSNTLFTEPLHNNGATEDLGVRYVKFKLSANSEINLYPNPAENLLKLEFQSDLFSKAEVVNLNGEVLQVKEISGNEKQLVFDIEKLASGTYFMRLKGNNISIVRQFVKL